jgi:hypothetical protein
MSDMSRRATANGTYQSISMAANTDLLLATDFKVPESTFAKSPKGPVVIPED